MDVLLGSNEATGFFDWTWQDGDILTGYGIQDLQTAIIVSIFSDARATPDFVLNDGTTNRRGFWASQFNQFSYGSTLWQLFRAGITSQTLLQAQSYVSNALAWMTTIGVAASVNVQCSWITSQALNIDITVTEPNTNSTIPFSFSYAWNTQAITSSIEIFFSPLGATLDHFILDSDVLDSVASGVLDSFTLDGMTLA